MSKDYYEYFGCVNGCDDAKPVHTNHDSDDCEIVCSVCGGQYASTYEEMCDTYFKPEQDGPACDWGHFARHTQAMQDFVADKERERIIELLKDNMFYSEIDLVLFWNEENSGFQVTLEDLIELIKGEQK